MTGSLQLIAIKTGKYYSKNLICSNFTKQISLNRILTGCYDSTIHLWNLDGTHRLTVPGHCGPIKGVRWVETDEPHANFASVSDDETVMFWKIDLASETVECIQIGQGHERAINFVDVNKNASFLVTGGWDNMLKIWRASNNSFFTFKIFSTDSSSN